MCFLFEGGSHCEGEVENIVCLLRCLMFKKHVPPSAGRLASVFQMHQYSVKHAEFRWCFIAIEGHMQLFLYR